MVLIRQSDWYALYGARGQRLCTQMASDPLLLCERDWSTRLGGYCVVARFVSSIIPYSGLFSWGANFRYFRD